MLSAHCRGWQGSAFYGAANTNNSQAISPCLNGFCLTINYILEHPRDLMNLTRNIEEAEHQSCWTGLKGYLCTERLHFTLIHIRSTCCLCTLLKLITHNKHDEVCNCVCGLNTHIFILILILNYIKLYYYTQGFRLLHLEWKRWLYVNVLHLYIFEALQKAPDSKPYSPNPQLTSLYACVCILAIVYLCV